MLEIKNMELRDMGDEKYFTVSMAAKNYDFKFANMISSILELISKEAQDFDIETERNISKASEHPPEFKQD